MSFLAQFDINSRPRTAAQNLMTEMTFYWAIYYVGPWRAKSHVYFSHAYRPSWCRYYYQPSIYPHSYCIRRCCYLSSLSSVIIARLGDSLCNYRSFAYSWSDFRIPCFVIHWAPIFYWSEYLESSIYQGYFWVDNFIYHLKSIIGVLSCSTHTVLSRSVCSRR